VRAGCAPTKRRHGREEGSLASLGMTRAVVGGYEEAVEAPPHSKRSGPGDPACTRQFEGGPLQMQRVLARRRKRRRKAAPTATRGTSETAGSVGRANMGRSSAAPLPRKGARLIALVVEEDGVGFGLTAFHSDLGAIGREGKAEGAVLLKVGQLAVGPSIERLQP
jgi:hypothetical protein